MLYNYEIKILICANQKNKIIFIVNKMIMCAMKSKCDERDTLIYKMHGKNEALEIFT